MKQTALLASPVYIGQAQGDEKKHIKRGAKIEPQAPLLFVFFGWEVEPHPSYLEDVFSFACRIKLSCNTGPSISSNFCSCKTEPNKLQTPLTEVFWKTSTCRHMEGAQNIAGQAHRNLSRERATGPC